MSRTSNDFGPATTGDEVVQAFADNVKGRTFLITGASAGSLGAETALSLSRHGEPANIVLLGRDKTKVDPVISELKSLNKSVKVFFVPIELSDETSIRAAAKEILSNHKLKTIDVLINSAGVMACPYIPVEAWKDLNGRPVELHFAANHLGHFLLANLLLDRIRSSSSFARIVNVSASGHRFTGIRFNDVGFSEGKEYNPWLGYSQSKTANILMAAYLGSNVPSQEVACFSLHPGAIQTPLGRHMSEETKSYVLAQIPKIPNMEPVFFKTLQQGCATQLVAALDPKLQGVSGSYLCDCTLGAPAEHASSKENAEMLWQMSGKIVGQSFAL